ncbi:hypothetical protein COO60DRAFT_1549277 [Scenedesmus sp. NREL 46B-D3]|nr:hypothetical protein COO60DRAFT_1549277 [Scenedesmus sp. NREL 46B-D3]
MPMPLGRSFTSMGLAMPCFILPRPPPAWKPIFSSSFCPMPLVCCSKVANLGSACCAATRSEARCCSACLRCIFCCAAALMRLPKAVGSTASSSASSSSPCCCCW